MKPATKQKESIEKLHSKHKLTIGISLCAIIIMLFTNDWVTYLCIAVAIIGDHKYEAEDELAKKNISKANTIIMWFLLAAMVILSYCNRWQNVNYVVYLCIACVAMALRSALFLWFDRVPAEDSEEC